MHGLADPLGGIRRHLVGVRRGTIEGHGLGASGAPEDEFSSVVGFRHAMDDESDNGYHRIGVLSPTRSSGEELCVPRCLHEISLELRFVGFFLEFR